MNKNQLPEASFWAKASDEVAHIVKPGYQVHCGKYGALLGNNYENNHDKICDQCLMAYKPELPVYACMWGNWESGSNDYIPEVTMEIGEDYFTAENGYDEDDQKNIHFMMPGQTHNDFGGNHWVIRIR